MSKPRPLTAASLTHGATFTVTLAAAIEHADGWTCRLASDGKGIAPTIFIPARAVIADVQPFRAEPIAGGEVDPLRGRR